MHSHRVAVVLALTITLTLFGSDRAEAQDNTPAPAEETAPEETAAEEAGTKEAPAEEAAAAEAATEEAAEVVDAGQRTEWVSLGYTCSTALGGGHGLSIGGPVLKWGSLYWQTAEYVATSARGDIYPEHVHGANRASIATIVGYRLPTSSDGSHELRAGLGAGWMLQDLRADCQGREGGLPGGSGVCVDGYISRDYYGLGLLPEFGWFWRMAPGVGPPFLNFVHAKLRLLVPALALNKSESADGEGIHDAHCEQTDCPWGSVSEPWTPDVSLSFSLAVGF